jgi:RILP-like protein 1
MPQQANPMAVVSSSNGLTLSTVDVYELASAIGSQFEKMIDCHGPESVTGLMPMVIRVLEHLEQMAKHNENEEAEIVDLRFTVERLQAEKKLKAQEHSKFEKVRKCDYTQQY